jgi:predicted aspartyl protease
MARDECRWCDRIRPIRLRVGPQCAARKEFQALAPVAPNDGSVEVPLRTTSSGFLSGEVGLDGFQKNVNFIIDTAASITVISEKLSQEEQLLDLLQPSKMRVFGAAGVTEDVKLLQLPRLSLGLSKLEKSTPRCSTWNR